jgi:hypothetical protein
MITANKSGRTEEINKYRKKRKLRETKWKRR